MDTHIQTYINNIRHHLSLKGKEPPTKIMQAIAQELDAMAEVQYLEIDTLQAGRELDTLVAEKVMEWRLAPDAPDGYGRQHEWFDSSGKKTGYSTWDKPFRPSTDISATWQVVEKLREQGIAMTISTRVGPRNESSAYCIMDGQKITDTVRSDTEPLAICRVALKALLMDME